MRGYRATFFVIPVGALTLLTLFMVRSCAGTQAVNCDFRDAACLAHAIRNAAQQKGDGTAISSSCAQTVFPDYVCSVAFYNGTVATYQVTVATDGSWWHTA